MKSFRYYFQSREELEAFMRERESRWLRRDSAAGHLEIRQPLLKQVDSRTFLVCWQLQVSSSYSGGWGQLNEVPEELLVELHDMIGKHLGLEPQPVQVKVTTEQPKPKKRVKRIVSPAQALEDASVVALTPEERAIHRRMLEGR